MCCKAVVQKHNVCFSKANDMKLPLSFTSQGPQITEFFPEIRALISECVLCAFTSGISSQDIAGVTQIMCVFCNYRHAKTFNMNRSF